MLLCAVCVCTCVCGSVCIIKNSFSYIFISISIFGEFATRALIYKHHITHRGSRGWGGGRKTMAYWRSWNGRKQSVPQCVERAMVETESPDPQVVHPPSVRPGLTEHVPRYRFAYDLIIWMMQSALENGWHIPLSLCESVPFHETHTIFCFEID